MMGGADYTARWGMRRMNRGGMNRGGGGYNRGLFRASGRGARRGGRA